MLGAPAVAGHRAGTTAAERAGCRKLPEAHRAGCEGLHRLSCERPLGAARLSPFPCLAVGLSPELPEDLYCLIKKAVSVRKHLDKFRQDKDAKFRLILIESRIHRIARYYKLAKALPPTFKYESATASTLVS